MKKSESIIKQGIKFIGLSGIGWMLDMLTYTLLGLISKNLFINNLISSFVGVSFVFVYSTRFVFSNNSKYSLRFKYLVYVFYQAILIVAVSGVLIYINHFVSSFLNTIPILSKFGYIVAKILVTPITMVTNFLVMKLIIEKL